MEVKQDRNLTYIALTVFLLAFGAPGQAADDKECLE